MNIIIELRSINEIQISLNIIFYEREVKLDGNKKGVTIDVTPFSWTLLGSNQRPSDYESDALTV